MQITSPSETLFVDWRSLFTWAHLVGHPRCCRQSMRRSSWLDPAGPQLTSWARGPVKGAHLIVVNFEHAWGRPREGILSSVLSELLLVFRRKSLTKKCLQKSTWGSFDIFTLRGYTRKSAGSFAGRICHKFIYCQRQALCLWKLCDVSPLWLDAGNRSIDPHLSWASFASNLCADDKILQTAPVVDEILPGIVRQKVLDVGKTLSIPVELCCPNIHDSLCWTGAFVTNW